jgi:hypothetical protein
MRHFVKLVDRNEEIVRSRNEHSQQFGTEENEPVFNARGKSQKLIMDYRVSAESSSDCITLVAMRQQYTNELEILEDADPSSASSDVTSRVPLRHDDLNPHIEGNNAAEARLPSFFQQ